jgi:hypothetical protein
MELVNTMGASAVPCASMFAVRGDDQRRPGLAEDLRAGLDGQRRLHEDVALQV